MSSSRFGKFGSSRASYRPDASPLRSTSQSRSQSRSRSRSRSRDNREDVERRSTARLSRNGVVVRGRKDPRDASPARRSMLGGLSGSNSTGRSASIHARTVTAPAAPPMPVCGLQLWDAEDSASIASMKAGLVRLTAAQRQEPEVKTTWTVGEAAVQGMRKTMEDETSINNSFTVKTNPYVHGPLSFYAVYDGHAGRGAALYARKKVLPCLLRELKARVSPPEALVNAFQITDDTVQMDGSGCTACAVIVERQTKRIWAANAGDSRAILCRGRQGVPLTVDQKPGDAYEKKRITDLGGNVKLYPFGVWRVVHYDVRCPLALAVARSLGDNHFNPNNKDIISGKPQITESIVTTKDQFLVVACDGLWDVFTDNEVAALLQRERLLRPKTSCETLAKLLTTTALKRRSMDNVSVIVTEL